MADPDDLVARAFQTMPAGSLRARDTHRGRSRSSCATRAAPSSTTRTSSATCARERRGDRFAFAAADSMFRGLDHRHFLWDPQMPLEFEARLQLEGYERDER